MPRKVVFVDATDTFSISETGALEMLGDDDETIGLVQSVNLEEFADWLNGEVSLIKADKAKTAAALRAANEAMK